MRSFITIVLPILALGVCSAVPDRVEGQCASTNLPVQEGMAVATLGSFMPGANQRVVTLIDTRDPATNAPGLDTNWFAPLTYNQVPLGPDTWDRANLGEVFGICLDAAASPNIYVTATSIYGGGATGAGGAGGVYRLDGSTGAISVLASLPNSGASLGNIDHDTIHDQLFVSNFDDGLIYRLDMAGATLSTFDHGVDGRNAAALTPIADDPALGPTQVGRRVWGLQVNEAEERLYYGVWWEADDDVPNIANEIWSVELDPSTGNFVPSTAQLEIALPALPATWQPGLKVNPAADLVFDDGGTRMVLAQRSMWGNSLITNAHKSRVLEYTGGTGVWAPSPTNQFLVGSYGGGMNAAGGVDLDCEGNVWATGDALHLALNDAIYGLQRIPAAGGSTVAPFTQTSYLVDLDCDLTAGDKTQVGDVEIRKGNCSSCTVEAGEILCDPTDPGTFTYTFTVNNGSGVDADRIRLFPSGFTITPDTIFTSVPDGGSATVTVTLSGVTSGTTVCFEVWLMADQFTQCCVVEHCVEVPRCCLDFGIISIECDPANPGQHTLTFDVTNLSTIPTDRIFLWPLPQPAAGYTMTPDEFSSPADFAGPLPTGGSTGPLVTVISGAPGGDTICFEVSIHDSLTGDCCFEEICVELPDCGGCDEPDECSVTEVMPCEPVQPGSDIHEAIIEVTICNYCSGDPADFTWTLDGTTGPDCPVQYLGPPSFAPSAGTTPLLAPGECYTFTVVVDCTNIPPGEYACYGFEATNSATGFSTNCDGRVYRPGSGLGGGVVDPTGTTDVPVGASQSITFELTNGGSQPGPFDVSVSENTGTDTVIPILEIDGQPVGTPSEVFLDVPPGTTTTLTASVAFGTHDPLRFHTVYLVADADGDGRPDPLASVNLRSVVDADCNGNGVPDDVEIAIGVEADLDGDGVPDSCATGQSLFIRGDANADQLFDIGDVVYTLSYIFSSGDAPGCLDAADSNADGAIDVGDPIYTLGALFSGGAAPPAPHPSCGLAPQGVAIGCATWICP